MDPYLEHHALWPDVHNRLITTLADFLSPVVAPVYYVAVESRAYIIKPEGDIFLGRPDIAVASPAGALPNESADPVGAEDVTVLEVELPIGDEISHFPDFPLPLQPDDGEPHTVIWGRKMKIKTLLCIIIILLTACNTETIPPTASQPTDSPAIEPTPQPPTLTPPPLTPIPDPTTEETGGYPWWNNAVFYEIFVRSFYDSDDDGVGDLNGLIEKLDYLNDGDPATTDDLGITGIWLMPIMQSPSYHGYDVIDYYRVDDEYGTDADFRRLIEEAHQRGIRVIIDLVLNHTGRDHPWFQASRDPGSDKRDWYIWADEDPGFRGPDGQEVWRRTPDGYYYALFWDGMPDLNLQNPDVTAELQTITRHWFEEMGVDGLRMDAIKHFVERGPLQENTNETHAWLADFHAFYKGVNPDAFIVGEAWTSTQQVLEYTGDEVDIAFEFDLARAAFNSIDSGLSVQLGKAQAQTVADFPPGQYGIFLTNHDQNRIMSQLDGDEEKAKLAATWLLTSPGVPFIYYGEEIGMVGAKPDEDIRRPMQWCSGDGLKVCFSTHTPWRFPAEDYATRSVARQIDDPDSLLSHYRRLIHLRNTHAALRLGDWMPIDARSARAYAYLRYTADEVVLVLFNLDDEPLEQYELSLESGPLAAGVQAILLSGVGAEPIAPVVEDDGGFTTYRPFDQLPAESSFVILLEG